MTRPTGAWVAASIAVASAMLASTVLFFYFRDDFSTHYPVKVLSAALFRSGAMPWWNFGAGGGQPLAGNPNTLTFYPDNVLYLVLPARIAFDLHFFLHVIAGFFAMAALAARLGAERWAARTAAWIYVLSGAAVSTLAFYNMVPAVALLPLIVLLTERFLEGPGWRPALLLGAACGLLGLAGEPVIVLSAAILMVVLGAGRLPRRALLPAAAGAAAALAIVSPLVLAYGEIAREVERAVQPYSPDTVLAASVSPARALEMLVGPFQGLVTELGPNGYSGSGRWPPLLPLLFVGAVIVPALAAPLKGAAQRLRLAALVLFLLALGSTNPLVVFLVSRSAALRTVRYPEKLAIAFTVAAVALTGVWLGRGRISRAGRIGLAAAGCGILAACAAFGASGGTTRAGAVRLVVGAALACGVLASAAWIERPLARRALVALTLVPLLYWAVRAAPLDVASPYGRPSIVAEAAVGRLWSPVVGRQLRLPFAHTRAQYRVAAQAADPLFGMTQGVRYAFDRSPEGMYSWLSRVVQERAMAAAWPLRVRYLRLLAVGTVVSPEPIVDEGLEASGTADVGGDSVFLYRVRDPLADVHPVRRLIGARSIQEAVAAIEAPGFAPLGEAVVPASAQDGDAGPVTLERAERGPQEIRLVVDAPRGGFVLVNESWFSAWRAREGAARLKTVPANIDRLGILVPPGRHEIVLSFGGRRGLVAACMALSAAVLLGALAAALGPFPRRTGQT